MPHTYCTYCIIGATTENKAQCMCYLLRLHPSTYYKYCRGYCILLTGKEQCRCHVLCKVYNVFLTSKCTVSNQALAGSQLARLTVRLTRRPLLPPAIYCYMLDSDSSVSGATADREGTVRVPCVVYCVHGLFCFRRYSWQGRNCTDEPSLFNVNRHVPKSIFP